MKKCPRCNCVYRDETLNFCLEDGAVLAYSPDAAEPPTAALTGGGSISNAPTWQNDPAETAEHTPLNGSKDADHSIHRPFLGKSRTAAAAVIAALLIPTAYVMYRSFPFGNDRQRVSSDKQIASIAILPFQNITGETAVDYVSDGISESLINSLTELQQLKVIARSTVFRYKGRDVEPSEVGRELNVRAVLMGKVRQFGGRINIQVDLVDAEAGTQLWGEGYERPESDLLSIKQSIAREIAKKLRLMLSDEQTQALRKKDTGDPEAYQMYLRGRSFWSKRTPEAITKAIEQFQKAVERDPTFALGYVGLADCYLLNLANIPAVEARQKARAAVDRALQIDPSLAEARTSSGYLYEDAWQWDEAEQEFQRALQLSPNYPTAHQWLGGLYLTRGRLAEAEKEYARARELDPLSPIIGSNVALLYLLKNDPGAAIEESKNILELNPDFPFALWSMGWSYVKQEKLKEAGEAFERAVEKSGRNSYFLSTLANFYASTGRSNDALSLRKELEDLYSKQQASGYDIAGVYVGLGDKDKTFYWLERDFQQHSDVLPGVVSDPRFEPIRKDPRYADLKRRMGL